MAERRFKSTVRSDCFREEGGLTREGDEEREASGVAILLPSFSPSPSQSSLSLPEYLFRGCLETGHTTPTVEVAAGWHPPLRGSENVPLSRDERATEVSMS